MFHRFVPIIAALGLCSAAQAGVVTMNFSASGFQNAGTQYAGFDGPISGSISWNSNNPGDAIGTLLAIDLEIYGHRFSLLDSGVANEGATQTAIGASPRGFNAVVGDGAFDDFLIVFDRVNPAINAFAYSIQGKTNAIWWTPAHTSASFANAVPEPAGWALGLTALGALGLARRRRATRGLSGSSDAKTVS